MQLRDRCVFDPEGEHPLHRPGWVAQAIAGGTSSTTALAGSTEAEQFEQPIAVRMAAGSPSQV